RLSRAFPSRSVTEAVARFESVGFDPRTDGVVAGAAPAGLEGAAPDASAVSRVLRDGPDALSVETRGAAPGLLHVDRSFTPRALARVDGRPVRALALDVHLIGITV